MQIRQLAIFILVLSILAAGCASGAAGDGSTAPLDAELRSTGATTRVLVTDEPVETQAASQPEPTLTTPRPDSDAELDRYGAELRARADLADFLQIPTDRIVTVLVQERVWQEGVQGCNPTRGMFPDAAVPGYLVTLEADGRQFDYHFGFDGTYVRCTQTGKPVGPIR